MYSRLPLQTMVAQVKAMLLWFVIVSYIEDMEVVFNRGDS